MVSRVQRMGVPRKLTRRSGRIRHRRPITTFCALCLMVVPSIATADTAGFSGVSCPTNSECIASGAIGPPGLTEAAFSKQRAFSEVITSAGWSTVAAVNPVIPSSLSEISCVSDSWCMAVGESGPIRTPVALSEIFDGHGWADVPVPDLHDENGQLRDVVCVSPTWCMASGYGATLFEQFDGSVWHEVPSPTLPGAGSGDPGSANSVAISCATAQACMAVGVEQPGAGPDIFSTFAERYRSGVWSLVKVPAALTLELEDVSCPTAGWCLAIGSSSKDNELGRRGSPRSVVFEGASVSVRPLPAPQDSLLEGVDCTAKWACVAVGGRGANHTKMLAERLTRTTWAEMRTPASFQSESDVSCRTEKSCVAVGSTTARLTGSVWSTIPAALSRLSTPCTASGGSLGSRLLRSLKCTIHLTVLEAECAVGVAGLLFLPLRSVRLVEGARSLDVLGRLPVSVRPAAKLVYDLAHGRYSTHAPKGFRTGAETIATLSKLHKGYEIILKLPDLARALVGTGYSQIALDLDEIAGLKPCVQAVAEGVAG